MNGHVCVLESQAEHFYARIVKPMALFLYTNSFSGLTTGKPYSMKPYDSTYLILNFRLLLIDGYNKEYPEVPDYYLCIITLYTITNQSTIVHN